MEDIVIGTGCSDNTNRLFQLVTERGASRKRCRDCVRAKDLWTGTMVDLEESCSWQVQTDDLVASTCIIYDMTSFPCIIAACQNALPQMCRIVVLEGDYFKHLLPTSISEQSSQRCWIWKNNIVVPIHSSTKVAH